MLESPEKRIAKGDNAMQERYNWKKHYTGLVQEDNKDPESPFRHYRLNNEEGMGEIVACDVFPGIQAVYNDLHLARRGRPVATYDRVIQINYCIEGRYQCAINSRYHFNVNHGDLSIGMVGCRESHGDASVSRFRGLTLYLELEEFSRREERMIRELGIALEVIRQLASQRDRYFVLHGNEQANVLLGVLTAAIIAQRLPEVRLKTLELLALLSRPEMLRNNQAVVYLSQKHARLANRIYERISEDPACRVNIDQLAKEFKAASTTIKTVFKSVYGTTIGQYQKSLRLQEAQRLLRETDDSIAEISAAVGYINPSKFTAAFRKTFSLTPSQYRVRLWQKNDGNGA